MTYNLQRYCLDDRDGDGQRNDPKPKEEVDALIRVIAAVRPDVLAVQEMGHRELFDEFRRLLRQAGLDYPQSELVPAPGREAVNLALLSRFPIVSRQPVTNEYYTMGEARIPVLRGFLSVDIQPDPAYRFRLLAAHLKSKVFTAAGQTEMRRNEARLLNKQVRQDQQDRPDINLLVAGDLNDSINSAALREAMGRQLWDLRPRDHVGDVWSHYWAEEETYQRIDYLLVNENMRREVVMEKTHVVRHPLTAQASDHRPLVAVFKRRDL
jgi:endonuclease/exonuclease/phosphatase family metal-dependent hydrolase